MPPKTYLPSDVLFYVQHAHSAGYKQGIDFAIHAMRIFDIDKDSKIALVLEFLLHESRNAACDNNELDEKLRELRSKERVEEPRLLENQLEALARSWAACGGLHAKRSDNPLVVHEGVIMVQCAETLLKHLGLTLDS